MKNVLIIGANTEEIKCFSKLLNEHTANVIVCGAEAHREKIVDFIVIDELENQNFVPPDMDSIIRIAGSGGCVEQIVDLMKALDQLNEPPKIQKEITLKIVNPYKHEDYVFDSCNRVSRGKGARARNRSAFKNKFHR